jgi:hypothetical protein
LPTVCEAVASSKVTPNTVVKAYRELELLVPTEGELEIGDPGIADHTEREFRVRYVGSGSGGGLFPPAVKPGPEETLAVDGCLGGVLNVVAAMLEVPGAPINAISFLNPDGPSISRSTERSCVVVR